MCKCPPTLCSATLSEGRADDDPYEEVRVKMVYMFNISINQASLWIVLDSSFMSSFNFFVGWYFPGGTQSQATAGFRCTPFHLIYNSIHFLHFHYTYRCLWSVKQISRNCWEKETNRRKSSLQKWWLALAQSDVSSHVYNITAKVQRHSSIYNQCECHEAFYNKFLRQLVAINKPTLSVLYKPWVIYIKTNSFLHDLQQVYRINDIILASFHAFKSRSFLLSFIRGCFLFSSLTLSDVLFISLNFVWF